MHAITAPNNTIPVQLTKVPPPESFLEVFNTLDEKQKNIIYTFIYCSLQTHYNGDNNFGGLLTDGFPGRYAKIINGELNIDLDISGLGSTMGMSFLRILPTDEQVLFGINVSSPCYKLGGFMGKENNEGYYLQVKEIYIDSSVMEKRAILRHILEYHNRSQDSKLID